MHVHKGDLIFAGTSIKFGEFDVKVTIQIFIDRSIKSREITENLLGCIFDRGLAVKYVYVILRKMQIINVMMFYCFCSFQFVVSCLL